MTVAIKKGAMCPLCKEPISRRSIFIDTQAKELSVRFEALFDAIQADTGTDIRNHVSKPGNEREGIRTPYKSNTLIERKNIRMNATKSHLLRNAKKNKAAAGPINLNESAKPIKDSENIKNNTRLESSNSHDVDHVNENKDSNIASIKYMKILKGIHHSHETVPRKKVTAWLESMEWDEELETIETKHNRRRNIDMTSKQCLPCATYTLDQLNIEGNPCKSNIDKIISDENKILSFSSAEADEHSRKTNNLLTVTMDVINGAVKSLSKESNAMSSKISEIKADKFANQNLKYKGVHLRVQEINKKLFNTLANDTSSRVMQFGNHNNTVNTTLSPYSYTNNQRMNKNTLSKSRDTVSEDIEESKVIDDVSSLKSSDRHNLSGGTDGWTVIMSNISYAPIVSSGGAGNTTIHSLSKTNVNNNDGSHFFEKITSEPKIISLPNSCIEVSPTQNVQRIDPDDKMHSNSLIQRGLQLISKDIDCVSTKNITAREACVNESDVSNQAMPLLSPIPNFKDQLVRHFGSPSRIERGQKRKYDCTLQDVMLGPSKLTPVNGRSLSQQMDLNDAKNEPFNDITIQSGTVTHSRQIQTSRRISELNIIEKQRLTIEELKLIIAKQKLTIKNQEIIINQQKLTIKEEERTTIRRCFSESQIPLKSSSVLLQVGINTNETFGQNETQKQNSSVSTSTNMKSIPVSVQSQSILIHSDNEDQCDNTCIEQEKNVLETKNISKSGSTNFINSQVGVVVDTCDDRETSLLTTKKNISPSTYIRCDEKFTPETDGSHEEVRTKKRKLSETKGCVNAKDFKEFVTKVQRIQNCFSILEKDLNRCEVTPRKNVIAPDMAKSGVKNIEGIVDNGMLSSNRDTPNFKDHIMNYQSHGKLDTQDRMAMEDNFNEAMANVGIQFLAGVIEGENEQSTTFKTNPERETNLLKLSQSTNASLDSEDAIERDSPTSRKPYQTNLHVDSSSTSKNLKEFYNLSQFSNNSNKEHCNINATQDRVLSTIDHNSTFHGESKQQSLVSPKFKSSQSKTQHVCNTAIKTAVHNNVACIEANSSTAYQIEEQNISNRNVADKKTADCQSVTSFKMHNQDKGVYEELLHEPSICERRSLMNTVEESMLFKNTQDKLCGKSKLKVVQTPAIKEMKSQDASSMRTKKSVFIHTTNKKNYSSADSCNKDYDIPYSEDDVVERTPENKLKVSPHAPNKSSPESWMSLNLTPIPKIMKNPSIATPSMNCKRERPVASYSNTVLASSSKVLETPNRDSRLFMLYESTPKISYTARNSWVAPEARLRERKSQLNLSTTGTLTCAKSQICKSTSTLCFLCTALTTEQIKNVQRFAKLVGAEFTTVFHPEVTHVIVATDSENNSIPRTLKYLQAIAHKKWVVSYSWVLDSLKQGILLEEEKYEPVDVFSSEPASRKSRLYQDALFEGFAFLCVGPFEGATVENYEDLVRCTGGHVVQTLDALAASNHQWKFIIIPDVIHDNELIGWYRRTKAVPVLNEWLLECISQYTIISLHSFIRELTSQDLLELGFPLGLVEPEESDVTNDASP
ncbi:uncharacterized protein LOC107267127 isoform X3 [Cephus cinctus]|nr:uncharacterized protein LOC107267127 isoform X3 [Cephus cinctus]